MVSFSEVHNIHALNCSKPMIVLIRESEFNLLSCKILSGLLSTLRNFCSNLITPKSQIYIISDLNLYAEYFSEDIVCDFCLCIIIIVFFYKFK